MKTILILSFLLSSMSSAFAESRIFCSLYHADRVIKIASAHSTSDKNRHCTVSCMLALKCPDKEVLMIGVLKEFRDLFGSGQAEQEDIEADKLGISLASRGAAKTDKQCLTQCDLYYR